jgi:hypothetical protein
MNEISKDVLPDYLQTYQGETGTEGLSKFVSPKYLKLIQGMSKARKELGLPEGTAILDDKTVVFPPDGHVMVTPILQWDQYELWYQKAAGMSNPVKDRSFDHTSDLAQVCLGPPKGWRVPDPDHAGCELIYKHVICYSLWVHALEKPVIITCSGGGHKSGKRFGELIFNRGDRYPITAGV